MVTTIYRNDYGFDLNFTAKDTADAVVDLTDSYATFKMAIEDSTINKVSSTCTIVSTTGGTCKYTSTTTDFDTVGVYKGEIQVTYSSGKIITFNAGTFNVIEDLPNT